MKNEKKTRKPATSTTNRKPAAKKAAKRNRYDDAAADLVAQYNGTPDGGWEAVIPDLAAATCLDADKLHDAVLRAVRNAVNDLCDHPGKPGDICDHPRPVDPLENMPGYREHSNALAAENEAKENFDAEIRAAEDGTGPAKAAALRAEAEANTPAAEVPAPEKPAETLPIDPKAPAGAKLKTCPVCGAFKIPLRWHFCNACWATKKAAKKAPASAAA